MVLTCHYCGKQLVPGTSCRSGKRPSKDHIGPKKFFQGIKSNPFFMHKNTVSSCMLCNCKKGHLLPCQWDRFRRENRNWINLFPKHVHEWQRRIGGIEWK